jgi:hypothetical protein
MCVENQIMAMYAFVDDSGSEPSQPYFVLGGLILPEETWWIFEQDWKHVLRSAPTIDYWKSSELWDRAKGPFKSLSTKERVAKLDAFSDIIFTYRPLAISTRMSWEVFNNVILRFSIPSEARNPYAFLFIGLLTQVAKISLVEPKFSKTNFVFDEQGKVGEDSLNLYRELWHDYMGDGTKELLGDFEPEFHDEKKVVQLQAADLFAWHHRRSILGTIGYDHHQRVWDRFRPILASTYMEESDVVKMGTDIGLIELAD